MRFGFVIPNNLGIEDPHALIRLGQLAESLGYDSIWVNHHILHVGYVKDRLDTAPYQDALVMLTWLASKTSTITLGTSVLVMPYLHPMALAKHLATLDTLSHGRLIVGLGAGSLPEENAALGAPYEERGKYCNEFIEVLRALWTEASASYKGEFFSFEDLCSSPQPRQRPHPPIVIGGNRPAALRRVAQLGDGWHPLNISPDGVSKRMQVIRAECERVDRPLPQIVQVRLDMARVNDESIAAYSAAGVTDLIVHVSAADMIRQESALTDFANNTFG